MESTNMEGEHFRENYRMRGHHGHRRASNVSMIAERD